MVILPKLSILLRHDSTMNYSAYCICAVTQSAVIIFSLLHNHCTVMRKRIFRLIWGV